MNEFDGRFTKLSFFASCRLSSVDLFTQVSVSLIGMCVMSFVSSLSGPLSVFGLGLPFPAFLFGFGELRRDSMLAARPLCLVVRLGGVLWSEVGGGVVLYRAGGGYCCHLGQLVYDRWGGFKLTRCCCGKGWPWYVLFWWPQNIG